MVLFRTGKIIMDLKHYIDNRFLLNKVAEVSYFSAKRKNKDKIYLINEGKEHLVETTIVTQGVNKEGIGTVIAINHNGALYIEHHNYFSGLDKFLDSLKDFCETIATKPIATTAQGPAPATPELIAQAKILSLKVEQLKKEIP